MTKNAKTAGISVATIALFCTLAAAYFMGQTNGVYRNGAVENDYVLRLASKRNLESARASAKQYQKNDDAVFSDDYTFQATTNDNNSIEFSYNDINFDLAWGTFNPNGCLSNSSAICGMKDIQIIFHDANSNLTLSYGWKDSKNENVIYEVYDVSLTKNNNKYNFNDDGPAYFKLTNQNNQNVRIDDIIINYSCSSTDNPYGGGSEGDASSSLVVTDQGNGSSTVSKYTGKESTVIIPEKHYDSETGTSTTITEIGDNVFLYNWSVKTVIIPDTVTTIGDWTFAMSNLETIALPDSVTSLGTDTFAYCYNLKNVTLGSGITTIPSYTFDSCSSLETITIPGTVKTIEDMAFTSCWGLKNIVIEDGVENIESYAFNRCGLESVTIPGSVKTIKTYTFSGCSSLASVTLDEGVTTINSNAFYNLTGLSSVKLPSSLTTIKSSAFSYCSLLTSIVIPANVTSIEKDAIGYGVYGVKAFYEGTSIPSSWNKKWKGNDDSVYFYSETSNTDGAHWHYVNDVPTIW